MESELVAGFFTEHSSVPFVFFFLAEYSSIVLFSCLTAIFFLGGYNMPELFVNDSFFNLQSLILGIKTCVFCHKYLWLLLILLFFILLNFINIYFYDYFFTTFLPSSNINSFIHFINAYFHSIKSFIDDLLHIVCQFPQLFVLFQ